MPPDAPRDRKAILHAIYEENRDLIVLGAYQPGRDRVIDEAIAAFPAIERLACQRKDESAPWKTSLAALLTLAGTR